MSLKNHNWEYAFSREINVTRAIIFASNDTLKNRSAAYDRIQKPLCASDEAMAWLRVGLLENWYLTKRLAGKSNMDYSEFQIS